MKSPAQSPLAQQIRETKQTRVPVEASLKTDDRILARITDGIYRQPSSALRELISNAYDADATEVVILTDAPRFSTITIRDNGLGLTPESLEHLIEHIGGSAKRTLAGADLEVTKRGDPTKSPGGRKLIGKLGIGLFSVAQFTRHFLVITKTRGDRFRTVADITLGPVNQDERLIDPKANGESQIERGHARIWTEPAPKDESQGTEVKLLDLLPRTRDELASVDLWARIDFEIENEGRALTRAPYFHIGRISRKNPDELELPPRLPWNETHEAREKFEMFLQSVRVLADEDKALVDIEAVCDRYLQTLWTLSLTAPLDYVDNHPFDLSPDGELLFFQLANKTKGQAEPLRLKLGETPRKRLNLKTPYLSKGDTFEVFIDGVQLFRPIVFREQPKTQSAVSTPLAFIGRCREEFEKKPVDLSGGKLDFEAYLFWTPKVIPTQHQGVMIRVGNAAGVPFDRTFMGYQVSEQTRLRQITAEVFVSEGLDGAINLDRESFNYAHPHYQFLVKWLHSAIRQLTNRHKEVGKELRGKRLLEKGAKALRKLDLLVEQKVKARGIEDVPEIVLLERSDEKSASGLRREGKIVLRKRLALPARKGEKQTNAALQSLAFLEGKAVAIGQILHAWGLLEVLSFEDQEILIQDILEILMADAE